MSGFGDDDYGEGHMLESAVDREVYDMTRRKLGGRYPLKFLVGERGRLPTQSHPGDAGFDLYVSEDTLVMPGEFVDVPTDVCCELPEGHWAMITGRSSTLRLRSLLVAQGVIDHGYRGELYSGVWNMGREPHFIGRNERVAQFVPYRVAADNMAPVAVTELGEHARGASGFGSTGA